MTWYRVEFELAAMDLAEAASIVESEFRAREPLRFILVSEVEDETK